MRSTQQAQDFRRCQALPSLVSRFTSKAGEFSCALAWGGMELGALSAALLRFRFVVRVRDLARSLLSLERLFIGLPRDARGAHRSPPKGLAEGALPAGYNEPLLRQLRQ